MHRHRGESSEAERCWRRILDLKRPDQFCSFDTGSTATSPGATWRCWPPSAVIFAEAGRLWDEVLAECPDDAQALAWLGRRPETTPACRQRARRRQAGGVPRTPVPALPVAQGA